MGATKSEVIRKAEMGLCMFDLSDAPMFGDAESDHKFDLRVKQRLNSRRVRAARIGREKMFGEELAVFGVSFLEERFDSQRRRFLRERALRKTSVVRVEQLKCARVVARCRCGARTIDRGNFFTERE
jgi:hypothetical protein